MQLLSTICICIRHVYAFEEKCSSSLAMDIIYAEVISPRLAYQHPLLSYKQHENC